MKQIHSGLDNKQTALLNQLLLTLNQEQKIWLGGYLTGINESTSTLLNLLNNGLSQPGLSASVKAEDPVLKIMYGTRSGNSKKLADKVYAKAIDLGISPEIVDLNDYEPKQLKKEKNLLIIVSTDGEGEPTVSSEEFYNFIHSKRAPKLKNLKYSVLALGDKTYQHYCKVGKDIDEQLAQLGASRFFDRIDCDVDFEEDSSDWIQKNLEKQKEFLAVSSTDHLNIHTPTELAANPITRESPYFSKLSDKFLLNGRGSTKKTWHIELSIEDSGINYVPGDSLGVICNNSHEFVDELMNHLGFKNDTLVKTPKGEITLFEAIQKHYEVTNLVPVVVKNFANISDNKALIELAENPSELDTYCYGRDIIDLIKEFKIALTGQEFIDNLRKLQPRLYSIASSYNYNPDEVHITVSQVEYNKGKRLRKGVASNFLAGLNENDDASIYIDENIGFRLPNDPHVPIIMIGAGTGIAPYRAFMQERSLSDYTSQNWLFFGDRNFITDFLYQTEWQKYHKSGLLTNIELAFSRDQKLKRYIQHNILENSKELYKWIMDGAVVYLCGDKNSMAKDVKSALLEVIRKEGNFSEGGAQDFFRKLRRDKQFQEDVY